LDRRLGGPQSQSGRGGEENMAGTVKKPLVKPFYNKYYKFLNKVIKEVKKSITIDLIR
jgi:hypothetical protein